MFPFKACRKGTLQKTSYQIPEVAGCMKSGKRGSLGFEAEVSGGEPGSGERPGLQSLPPGAKLGTLRDSHVFDLQVLHGFLWLVELVLSGEPRQYKHQCSKQEEPHLCGPSLLTPAKTIKQPCLSTPKPCKPL